MRKLLRRVWDWAVETHYRLVMWTGHGLLIPTINGYTVALLLAFPVLGIIGAAFMASQRPIDPNGPVIIWVFMVLSGLCLVGVFVSIVFATRREWLLRR